MVEQDAYDIWGKVKGLRNCFDDFTRDRADIFLARIASPSTATFRFNEGLVMIQSIVPKLSAEIHFFIWDKMRDFDMLHLGNDALREAFDTYQVHRLNAFPPTFNKQANRLAIRLGFRWEGRLREQFLYDGKYCDVEMYGMLKPEFDARGGRY